MSEISKKIVDQIESGELNSAKESIFQGMKAVSYTHLTLPTIE